VDIKWGDVLREQLSGRNRVNDRRWFGYKSSDDLVEANEKLEAFLAEAVKESKIEKLQK
jgi:hypothetical protein